MEQAQTIGPSVPAKQPGESDETISCAHDAAAHDAAAQMS
jgi:hypothetical protein